MGYAFSKGLSIVDSRASLNLVVPLKSGKGVPKAPAKTQIKTHFLPRWNEAYCPLNSSNFWKFQRQEGWFFDLPPNGIPLWRLWI